MNYSEMIKEHGENVLTVDEFVEILKPVADVSSQLQQGKPLYNIIMSLPKCQPD